MYLPTVLGDTRIPSLTNTSLAMRSSPHRVFSIAIRRMNCRSSTGMEADLVATCNARTVDNPLDASAQPSQAGRQARTIASHITGRAKQGLAEWRHRYVGALLHAP